MTAYEFIQQHPEWVKDLETPRREIEAQAARYVQERDGSRNFNALITEDIEILLFAREAILLGRNVTTSLDIIRDFANVIIDSKEITEADNIIIDDGAKRQARVYAIFIKAIIAELNGKAICTAAQVERWRERYGVKLKGLHGNSGKTAKPIRELEPIEDIKAEKIWTCLKNWGYIDCNEDVFLWHFGERKNRNEKPAPETIEWKKNLKYVFAYCCSKISKLAEPGNSTNWKDLERHFKANPDMNWKWENANGTLKDAKKVEANCEIDRLKKLFDDIKEMDNAETIKKAKQEGFLLGQLAEKKKWEI